jgi:hypothetical protein
MLAAGSVGTQLSNGFWAGLGLAAAFLVWSTLQMLWHRARAEGGH